MLTKLSNNEIEVEISTLGAELRSIIKDGVQLLWQGDPAFWKGRAPVLFPICGGLKDGKYIFDGVEYNLPRHGFARNMEFELEQSSEDKAVFLLKSNNETKSVYPFDFELRIIYTLISSAIKVDYEVKNIGNNPMYYSIGSHEAYACPEGIEEYSVLFENAENLNSPILEDALITYNTFNVGENTKELPLKTELFKYDTLIFENIKSKKVTLKNRKTGKERKLEFSDFDNLLIWTVPGAGYVCLEPWCGLADFAGSNYDLTIKKGINKLEVGKTDIKTHLITF